jgi:quercetin dioxygenase-like cupin family protein
LSVRTGRFDDLPVETPFEGVRRRTFHSAGATVASYELDPGARFPLHRHPEEQVTVVQRGEIVLHAGDRAERQGVGCWSVVPGGVEHGIEAGASGAAFLILVVPRRNRADAYVLTEPGDT